jgi:peptidoglycan hydrolase CwlO-like protein
MKTKKQNYIPDKKKSSGKSFKKNIAIAAVAASLGVSLGVPVKAVMAGDENITTQDGKNVSSVQGKIEANQGKFKSNQGKVEAIQGKHKSNQIKIEANQGKFKADQGKIESIQGKIKADQIKGEAVEENVQK